MDSVSLTAFITFANRDAFLLTVDNERVPNDLVVTIPGLHAGGSALTPAVFS